MADKSPGPLTFGFDIGIASVGWAVLSPQRIVALGVRAFDAAENPKTGAPLNEHRRLMRTARNRLKRRALRLKKLRRLLRDAGLFSSADTTAALANSDAASPWELRAQGLDRRLEPLEWARAAYHVVKHRGFFAARKSETLDTEAEGGRLAQGVKRTSGLMKDRWRTPGEMAARDEAFAEHKRNKAGDYTNTFDRRLLGEELRLLFRRQRELGNPHASEGLEHQVLELFAMQKAPLTGTAMLEMIGRCTFEKDEYRAPKRGWSAERFVWLSKLASLRIVTRGERRPLSDAERRLALDLPYKLSKLTYKQLRAAIELESSADAGFAGLSYGSRRNRKGEPIDPEAATLVELKGWHALRKALESAGLEQSWQRISADPDLQDAIALALSIYKTDAELRPALAKLALHEKEIEALLTVDFKEFVQLSVKAIGRLLPFLEAGLRYDEACERAGYDHALADGGMRSRTLPPLVYRDLRNPVVFRALGQARKVLNNLVRTYGSPCAVHIELARDLAKPFEERMEIRRGQEAYREARGEAEALFEETFGRKPIGKHRELEKFRLYQEQGGKCAYSLETLDLHRVANDPAYAEIDHALPYSRSFDDSQNNRVLVLSRENRNKGNRTPYEYLDGANESERWRGFEAWVRAHKNFRKAKRDRLLRVHFGAEEAQEFKERNLNDTRYIARYFAGLVRNHLVFAPDESGSIRKNPVLCPAGGFTGFLRARWGLVKNRDNGDLHHALDACVVAAASPALIKRVADFSRRAELLAQKDGTFVDPRTGEMLNVEAAAALGERFPQPWPLFRDEILARLDAHPKTALGDRFPAYDATALIGVRPVLVSRAVRRRAGGAIHEDTVRSVAKHIGVNKSARRVPVESLKLADLDAIIGADDPRNAGLMGALRERLEAHKGDGKKAFGPGSDPVRKPRRDGTPGPVVRAVKVKSVQNGGVPVRGGVADQASMWRVDVFAKGSKYFLVPIYQSDRRPGKPLPDRACVAHKPRGDWDVIDASFQFRFSLYPNDLIRLRQRGKTFFGYFAGMDIGSANISILVHDRNPGVAKDGLWRGLGVKLGVEELIKFNVDVLGNAYPARPEAHRGLA